MNESRKRGVSLPNLFSSAPRVFPKQYKLITLLSECFSPPSISAPRCFLWFQWGHGCFGSQRMQAALCLAADLHSSVFKEKAMFFLLLAFHLAILKHKFFIVLSNIITFFWCQSFLHLLSKAYSKCLVGLVCDSGVEKEPTRPIAVTLKENVFNNRILLLIQFDVVIFYFYDPSSVIFLHWD